MGEGGCTGFTCPVCGRVSRNPHDLYYGWCGACCAFTAAPAAAGEATLPPVVLWYGLDHRPVHPAEGYALLLDAGARVVARDELAAPGGAVVVSTVFTVWDYSCGADAAGPLLYDTGVFGGQMEQLYGERSRTRPAALAAHGRALAYARRVLAARGRG